MRAEPLAGRAHMSVEDAQSLISGWHFAKECLSESEREMLAVAEALLRELESVHGGQVRTGLRPTEAAQVATLVRQLVAERTEPRSCGSSEAG